MPVLGEIQNGKKIGIKDRSHFIWAACEICGKQRWVRYNSYKLSSHICQSCQGKRSAGEHRWYKGGRRIDSNEYICVALEPNDFFFPMADSIGYVKEHRLIMAKHLGRLLEEGEIVHHKGTKYPEGSIENKQDNRIENLQLMLHGEHSVLTNHSRPGGYKSMKK